MVGNGEKWLKNGNFAEVILQGSIPRAIIADCGSASVPRNQERAKAISCLPDILAFLEIFHERAKIVEKMNRNEAHVVIPIQDYNRLLASLKSCGLKAPELASRLA